MITDTDLIRLERLAVSVLKKADRLSRKYLPNLEKAMIDEVLEMAQLVTEPVTDSTMDTLDAMFADSLEQIDKLGKAGE